MTIRSITSEDDASLAQIIREGLERHGLDIPGTVYFDQGLDHLSRFYRNKPGRAYYVAVDDMGQVVGGAGFAEFPRRPGCAELQKLYLDPSVQGQGRGYRLIKQVQEGAWDAGYREIYLETHHALKAAVHMYRRMGYVPIPTPEEMVHSSMDIFLVKKLSGFDT